MAEPEGIPKGGGGRGGDTPFPPSDLKGLFTACLKIDSCNVRMAYYFLTSLAYLGTSVKKKKMHLPQ